MRQECSGAATAATAPLKSARVVYHSTVDSTTTINEILARFVFGLQSPRLSPAEKTSILDVIDNLLRLKIDLGLVREVRHVQ